MGYKTMRAAFQSYFAGIPGLQQMYLDAPWFLDGARWNLNAGQEWGAIGFIHIDHTDESRIALPAYTGKKDVEYTVSLVLQYQYLIPSYLPAGTSEDDWVHGLDDLIDATKTLLRADQTAATGGTPVFQIGEQPQDIAVDQDLPVMDEDGGRIYSLSRVEFHATEIITA